MSATVETTPLLWAGDFLSREEFLRRWMNQPKIKRAELLRGVVYMPSPVSAEHGRMEFSVAGWLNTYLAATPGMDAGNNVTTFLGDDSPQPDVHLRILRELGGRSWVEGGYIHGPPELIVEVCATSAVYDLHVKYDLYQEAGVQEYLAVVLFEKEIRWHQLVDGEYRRISPDSDGVSRSRVLPGLWLDGAALLGGDCPRVLEKTREGITSPEHRKFVADLASRRLS